MQNAKLKIDDSHTTIKDLCGMPLNANSQKVALVIFTGGLVVSTCLAGFLVWHNLRDTIKTRSMTRSLFIRWQQVYSSCKDAETGVRGYIITGKDEYLKPFNESAEQLLPEIQEISRQEGKIKNGYDTQKLAEFQKLTDHFLSELRESITILRREGKESAITMHKDDSAKVSMDALRMFCEKRLSEIDKRLDYLDQKLQDDLIVGGRSVAALAVAAVLAGLAAWYLLRDSIFQSHRADRLRTERQKADQLNREKSTFLATMSHEIRTPMNAVLGFGELLLDDARDDKQRNYAGSIVRSGQALLQLINDILDLSKIEAGMIEIVMTPVNVREIADFTRQLFTHQCLEKGISLRVKVDEDVPTSLMLDIARLRQIVINLIGNAIKFTQGGQVTVHFHGEKSAEKQTNYRLVLDVQDTGTGIQKSQIEEIFDPFVQAKMSINVETKGTGLGLAIVKRLTSLMGGTISVTSEEGKGSRFTLVLPDLQISVRLPKAAEIEQINIDFNQLRPSSILVVDDNPLNLMLSKSFFDQSHHTINTAENGKDAIDWLENHSPDVVLMDIRMPIMNGRTALIELRKLKNFELLPVIAVTASSMAGEDENELRVSFDGYLRKPYSRAQLLQELSHFIPPYRAESFITTAVETGPAPAEWAALVMKLREIERSDWPHVCEALVMSEVKLFATNLISLAKFANCPLLEVFATNIQKKAEVFALDELEKILRGFPSFIQKLEDRTHN